MSIRTNKELLSILAGALSKTDQVRLLDSALTPNKRIKAKQSLLPGATQENAWANGTLFRDAALIGAFTFDGVNIVGYGKTSDLTTCLAANLGSGVSVLRIEGGGHWVEGTVGLPGSGADFIFPTNPTTTNSIAIAGSMRLTADNDLPDGTPSAEPLSAFLATSTNTIASAQPMTITVNSIGGSGVSRVEFYRSGVLLGERTSAPWQITDTVSYFENGTRHYYAKVYDSAGNMGESPSTPVSINLPLPAPKSVPAVAVGASLVPITIDNTSSAVQSNVPVTFGQAFARGAFPSSGAAVELKAGSAAAITCQLDVRDTYADGSIKHASISAIIPSMAASSSTTYSILRKTAAGTVSPALPSDFPGLDSVVTFTEDGVPYSISLANLLSGARVNWLSGNIVSEWEVFGSPKNPDGVEHAHLHVRFCARAYKGQNKAVVDIAVENTWANIGFKEITANVSITVGGSVVKTYSTLVHRQSARYRETFWWNTTAPAVHIKHDFPYLVKEGILPNFYATTAPSASTATAHKNNTITKGGPYGNGTILAGMPTTGAHGEIGIVPGYAALYILLGNEDSKIATLNQGNLSGGWSMHRRDKATGRVISLTNQPKYPNGVPAVLNANTNALTQDRAHHPDQAFIPYLVTGDIYYLEELIFWAMYCSWGQNPNFRQAEKGLFQEDQVRAQGWCMRTMLHAAWITPASMNKAELEFIRKSNVDWYDARYTNSNAKDARLGANFHQFTYGNGGVSFGFFNTNKTFMDHFLTASIGRGVELGFTDMLPLLGFKAKYVNAMLYGVKGVCWVQAGAWVHRIREGNAGSAPYESMREVAKNTFSPAVNAAAEASNCATQAMADAWLANDTWRKTVDAPFQDGVNNPFVGDMDGYSDSPTGYPSNMQIALAYTAEFKTHHGPEAWEVFMGRSVKPNYDTNPQFNITPRQQS